MSSTGPVIAVALSFRERDVMSFLPTVLAAIVRAGGLPMTVDTDLVISDLDEVVRGTDGLLLMGGGDISPAMYGGNVDDPTVYDVKPIRDANDALAVEAARAAGAPVLAICRGAQLVAAAMGGSLYQDLARDFPASSVEHRGRIEDLAKSRHEIDITPGSMLAEWIGADGIVKVNSQHHQAVRELPPGATAVARSHDGLIEAFEFSEPPMLAVQWHPEVSWPNDENAWNIMRSFVDVVRARVEARVNSYSPA